MNFHTFPAYMLANDGYDVWMLNCRGSKYSMRHRSIDPSTFQFWQFSFHEIGIFDYPAAIDYIIALTGKPSVYFIGHNQATSAMLALLSTRPDYSAKLLHLHFLAPIAWMDYIHPLSAFNADRQMRSFYMTRTYNFFSIQDLSKIFIKSYCNDGDPSLLPFCMNMWFMLFGRNRNGTEMDPMLLYEIHKYVSPTASTRQWNHYLQIHKSSMFQTYDGKEDSYYEGGPIPYDLDLIRSPVFLYHGAEDLVVSKLVKCGTKELINNHILITFTFLNNRMSSTWWTLWKQMSDCSELLPIGITWTFCSVETVESCSTNTFWINSTPTSICCRWWKMC